MKKHFPIHTETGETEQLDRLDLGLIKGGGFLFSFSFVINRDEDEDAPDGREKLSGGMMG